MDTSDILGERNISALALAALLLSSFFTGFCASETAASSIVDAKVAQAAPSKASIYDPPPQRDKPAMTLDERLRLQKDLAAARDRHAPSAKPHPARPAQPAKP
jgi:hypothetical protein